LNRAQISQHGGVAELLKKFQKQIFCLVLALATVAVFWPVLHNGFVEYDDDEYIFENPVVKAGWTAHGFAWAFMGFHCVNYHPLTWLSHMTDCQLFGVNAGAHHLVNVALHTANAVLLLLLLDALTKKFWRSAFVAAFFALHPLRVESVAWAAERKDVLCAFFFLLTLLAYVRHVRAQKDPLQIHVGRELRLALIFFLCALLSKQMAVTLPVILLLLDSWPLRRMQNLKNDLPSLLKEKWPFIFLSAIFSATIVLAQHGTLPTEPAGVFARIKNFAADYFAYLEKNLWPQNLSFLYERHEPVSNGEFFSALLLLLGIFALAIFYRRRHPWLFTGWFWFVVMLLPVTAVALNKLSIADRYTYLPCIGFFVMLVWAVAELGQNFFQTSAGKILAIAGVGLILFLCAEKTREQIGFWRNSQTLTEHALQLDPQNDVAQQILRIYKFEQEHPGVREKNFHTAP
jgi:protein O-mannosyl-transferase